MICDDLSHRDIVRASAWLTTLVSSNIDLTFRIWLDDWLFMRTPSLDLTYAVELCPSQGVLLAPPETARILNIRPPTNQRPASADYRQQQNGSKIEV